MNNIRLLTVSVLAAGVALAVPAVAQETPRYDGPIIDMHMHAFPLMGKMPAPCLPAPCEGVTTAAESEEDVMRMTLKAMDRYNIVKGFLSGDLKRVAKWKSAAPDRFIASPLVTRPSQPGVEMLRQEYAAGRLSGMGELNPQLIGIRPNDPTLEPYFALAEELDLPVLIHTLGIGPPFPGFRVAAGDPVLLEEVLVRHRNLRLFVENGGFPFTSNMIAMMYQYSQLYADLSTVTWVVEREAFLDHFRRLMRAGLGKRIMFGSDQMSWPEAIGLAVEAIQSTDFLSAEQKADIFYNNAARFLRLSEEEIARHHGR